MFASLFTKFLGKYSCVKRSTLSYYYLWNTTKIEIETIKNTWNWSYLVGGIKEGETHHLDPVPSLEVLTLRAAWQCRTLPIVKVDKGGVGDAEDVLFGGHDAAGSITASRRQGRVANHQWVEDPWCESWVLRNGWLHFIYTDTFVNKLTD